MAGLEEDHQKRMDETVRKDAVYRSEAEVLAALKRRKHDRLHVSQEAVSLSDRPLKSAAYRFFGSWPTAIEAAGLSSYLEKQKELHKPWGPYPSAGHVIAELKRRAAEGESIVLSDVITSNDSKAIQAAAIAFFGSWKDAVKAAGLMRLYQRQNPKAFPKYPDADSVIREVLRRKKKGLSLSLGTVMKEDSRLKSAAWRFCGSWTAALSAAGVYNG
jgi:hypothetical protein